MRVRPSDRERLRTPKVIAQRETRERKKARKQVPKKAKKASYRGSKESKPPQTHTERKRGEEERSTHQEERTRRERRTHTPKRQSVATEGLDERSEDRTEGAYPPPTQGDRHAQSSRRDAHARELYRTHTPRHAHPQAHTPRHSGARQRSRTRTPTGAREAV